ncbi:MAG: hypothetical protein ABI554_06570 [Flavobacterium sp.]
MKITFLTLLLALGFTSFAQTHQLVKHDGAEHHVNFIKHENNVIHYSHPGSQEQQKISSHAVASIKHLKSSDHKKITEKVAVTSKSQYQKVKVLQHEDHALGLRKATVFKGQLNKAKGISSSEQFANTTRSVKYRAAEKGYPFVAINKKSNGTYEAIAYTY